MIRVVDAFVDWLSAGDRQRHDVPDASVPSAGTSRATDQSSLDPQEAADRRWRQRMHMKTADAFDDEGETDD